MSDHDVLELLSIQDRSKPSCWGTKHSETELYEASEHDRAAARSLTKSRSDSSGIKSECFPAFSSESIRGRSVNMMEV